MPSSAGVLFDRQYRRMIKSRSKSTDIRFDRFFAALARADRRVDRRADRRADRRVPTTVPTVSGPLDSADSVTALRTPTRTTRQLGHHDHLPSLLTICLLIII